jgi:tetratricopeptide (TPR) repeat protein
MRIVTNLLSVLLILLTTGALHAQSVEMLIARGDSADKRLDLSSALRQYQNAERIEPRNPEVLWRLSKVTGAMAMRTKDEKRAETLFKRALAYAERAVESEPNNSMAQVSLAISNGQLAVLAPATEKLELSKKIRDHSQRALELNPSNYLAMLVLGIWNREVASLNWFIKLTMKVVYGGVPEASLEESRRLLAKAVALEPGIIMTQVELAKTLIKLDENQGALTHLRRALSLPKRDVGDDKLIDEARELLRKLT